MTAIHLKMHMLGDALYVYVQLFNLNTGKFEPTLLTFDTGASTTTISSDILSKLGYDISSGAKKEIITGSGVEPVREIFVEKIKIAGYELNKVRTYAHNFPDECFSSGVIGLNILSQFDINLLFSKKLIELKRI